MYVFATYVFAYIYVFAYNFMYVFCHLFEVFGYNFMYLLTYHELKIYVCSVVCINTYVIQFSLN